ncbi:MAG: hypothetical protein L3J96_00340 [Thermoplasmata archaeon]|nr:hypothetical protein [Thermoplasmata archaeon]
MRENRTISMPESVRPAPGVTADTIFGRIREPAMRLAAKKAPGAKLNAKATEGSIRALAARLAADTSAPVTFEAVLLQSPGEKLRESDVRAMRAAKTEKADVDTAPARLSSWSSWTSEKFQANDGTWSP